MVFWRFQGVWKYDIGLKWVKDDFKIDCIVETKFTIHFYDYLWL